MKKSTLLLAIVWLWTIILSGCNSKEVWDVDYDLTTEIGRQLHCYAQFQKNNPAKEYWAEWVSEITNWKTIIVEWRVKSDDKEYNLVCNYSDDLGEISINYTPVEEKNAVGDPAAEYCNKERWEFEIVSNETNIYGQCLLPNGMVCEVWKLYNGECPSEDDEFYSNYYGDYVRKSLTNEDLDRIEEILPPISYDYEIWDMSTETLLEQGSYTYPEDVEKGYVFIPEHANMVSREIKSSWIEDGMIYTLADVTLQGWTVISVLYIHEPETLFCRAITVENGNKTTYYRNFLYNYDILEG